jgi:predicted RNase H-like HicB family nuclease
MREKMNKFQITYCQDNKFWLGFINDYPEYTTQGMSLDEFIENLKDIYMTKLFI